MKQKVKVTYGPWLGSAEFQIDREIYTDELAKITLEYFSWDYDENGDPFTEVMKKIGLECIKVATFNTINKFGVVRHFDDNEGFPKLDGSTGIILIDIDPFEFDDENIELEMEEI